MPSLVGIIIIVSGVVFGSTLLGGIAYDQYQKWNTVEPLPCDCDIDIDSDVYPWQVSQLV